MDGFHSVLCVDGHISTISDTVIFPPKRKTTNGLLQSSSLLIIFLHSVW